jgi:hypothetical protein
MSEVRLEKPHRLFRRWESEPSLVRAELIHQVHPHYSLPERHEPSSSITTATLSGTGNVLKLTTGMFRLPAQTVAARPSATSAGLVQWPR